MIRTADFIVPVENDGKVTRRLFSGGGKDSCEKTYTLPSPVFTSLRFSVCSVVSSCPFVLEEEAYQSFRHPSKVQQENGLPFEE